MALVLAVGIKKLKTCGPLFLSWQQNLQKKFWSVSHRFSVKTGQSIGGIFDIADYIYIVRLSRCEIKKIT